MDDNQFKKLIQSIYDVQVELTQQLEEIKFTLSSIDKELTSIKSEVTNIKRNVK